MLRLLALVACGTRTVIDAVFGPTSSGETSYAPRPAGAACTAGMIVLADRNFAAAALIDRDRRHRRRPAGPRQDRPQAAGLRRLPDGSYLSQHRHRSRSASSTAEITIATSAGRRTGVYRLVTTLLDHRRYPAAELVTLYHERWEIETAFLELKSTILGGRVLRARTPAGIDQEIYALLITYQMLRIAISRRHRDRPDVDPDRASFTIALHTARDQLIQAAGVIADTVIDLVGTIGRHVLDQPHARPAAPHQPPHRQTRDLQIRGQHRQGPPTGPSRPATITIDIQPELPRAAP